MRIAIVGAGRMGNRHIQAVKELGMSLAGICDLSNEALQQVSDTQMIEKDLIFTDYTAMLKLTHPDGLIIATTAPSHCELVCQAAESGVQFILCEKPMAPSLVECDRMLDACAKHGVRLAVNHQMRFMELYRKPKQRLESEEYQGLKSMTVVGGNFGLAMNGSHYFEACRFMTDEEPVEVTAWLSSERVPNPRGSQFEDRAGSVRITTSGGHRFYLEAWADQGHGMQVIYSARNGQILVDELTGTMHATVRIKEHRVLPTTRYGMPATSETIMLEPVDAVAPSMAVLKALIEDKDYPDGNAGRQAVAVLVAAHLSDQSEHRTILLNHELPSELRFPWA